MLDNLLPFIPAVAIALIVIAILVSGYVKSPPDIAYIISGLHKKPRILIGKAGIKIPFLERLDKPFQPQNISMFVLILLYQYRLVAQKK